MKIQWVNEAIPIGIAAVFSGALAVLRLAAPGDADGPGLRHMMAGETVWALGEALEPIIVELPIKRSASTCGSPVR